MCRSHLEGNWKFPGTRLLQAHQRASPNANTPPHAVDLIHQQGTCGAACQTCTAFWKFAPWLQLWGDLCGSTRRKAPRMPCSLLSFLAGMRVRMFCRCVGALTAGSDLAHETLRVRFPSRRTMGPYSSCDLLTVGASMMTSIMVPSSC